MSKYGILVIDDSPFTYKIISACIKETDLFVAGYASDGYTGIEKYKELKPDIVTLDMTMPGMDGLETAREIKKFDPNAKIIILTATDYVDIKEKFTSIGIDTILPKPFKNEHFILEALSILKK